MPEHRPAKRRKTPLACQNCRQHKIKCDGDRPVCGNCSRRGRSRQACIWKHVDGRPDIESTQLSAESLRQLEQRIHDLESRGRTAAAQPSESRSAHQTHTSVLDGPSPQEHLSEQRITPTTNACDTNADGTASGPLGATDASVPQNEEFMGSASAKSLINMIREAVDPSLPGTCKSIDTTAEQKFHQVPPPDYVLPPRREADRLIKVYWDYIHPLYPFLYKPSIEAIIQNLWAGESLPNGLSSVSRLTETGSACIINMVLALACQYHDISEHNKDRNSGPRSGQIFFNRAQTFLRQDSLNISARSLQDIQALLLMAQYLNSTGSPLKAWDIIGLAIRHCQGLGMHRRAVVHAMIIENPVEAEMVKRVWHGCLLMDRMISMTLGRPVVSAAQGPDPTPLPSELDESLFQSGQVRAAAISSVSAPPAMISFLVHSAKLFEIMQQILLAFYPDDSPSIALGPIDFSGFTEVFKIDAQLTSWLAATPRHLQFQHDQSPASADSAEERVFRRQALVMRNRLLLARIYLYRPLLSRTCIAVRKKSTQETELAASRLSENLSHRAALQCSILCVHAAIEVIHTIKKYHTTAASWGVKPAWLYGVLHIYLAATVLLAARLSPEVLLGEITLNEIQDAWHDALDTLGRFQADDVSAQRCIAALIVLYRGLPGGARQGEDAPDLGAVPVASSAEDLATIDVSNTMGSGSWGPLADLEFDTVPNMDWMPDIHLTEPYDMTWFHITAPDFGSTME